MRVLFLISIFFFLYACHSSQPKVEVERSVPSVISAVDSALIKTTAIFRAATAEYIKAFFKKDKPDTLFLSRNPEFPNITLPVIIEKIPIRIIDTDEGHAIAKRRPMTILNLINFENGEFLIVIFKDGFRPQYNCYLYFSYEQNEYKLDSLRMEYPYEKTRKRSH
jgi:hypothetical protein